MKRILSYILLCTLLLGSGCIKEEGGAQGEGAVNFRIELSTTTRANYNPMDQLLIRIYKADNSLIRRYTSLTEMPETLYLIAGDYKITVDAGDKSTATWINKTYHGEKAFTVLANQVISAPVVCHSINVAAQATFDPSVSSKLDKGAYVYVSASNSFDLAAIGTVPTLKFDATTSTATGYFLLPKGVTNLSWGFYGESSNAEIGTIAQTGVITNAEPATLYKLKFKYSKTPDGFVEITVLVDKTTEDHNDNIIFNPQPSIKGDGFDMNKTFAFNNNAMCFNISSVKSLKTVNLTTNGTNYPLFNASSVVTPPTGIVCTPVDANNVTVTLGPAFLATFTGGIHTLQFDLLDIDNGVGTGSCTVASSGVDAVTSTDYDLWANTGTLKAIVTNPTITDVKIFYRVATTGTWNELTATKGTGFYYTATATPAWTQSTNSTGKSLYTHNKAMGIRAHTTYEYYAVLGGVTTATRTFTTAGGDQIASLNNAGLSCYTTSNSADANFWGSGNNGTTAGLCSYDGAESSAKLSAISNTATSIASMFAPGNLFSGVFNQTGMNGTVGFGNKYAYTARPTALKLRYKANIGTVNYTKHGSNIAQGKPDKARIIVAIVDWTARHGVTSGVGKPSGMWDPESGTNAVTEGKIIGYGSIFIEGQTATMTELTLPISYYDKEAKPT
ncbi:MAG: DUF4493 domain-containing protein, partial [Alistipes sp.]